MVQSADRIPVTILTGFLGAGKSTLLNRLLRHPGMAHSAVIINEFGDVSIDHLLVGKAEDQVVELSDGCLCCTVRGALVDTIADLVDRLQTGRIERLDRIVIETTGLADPAPVMQSVIGHPMLTQSIALDGVVTLVDAVNGLATLAAHAEAVRQVVVADRLILSKRDLATPEQLSAITDALRSLNARAPIHFADAVDGPEVLVNGLYDPATKAPDVARWLSDEDEHHHAHDHHGHDHDHDHSHNHHHDHDGHVHHHDHHHHGHQGQHAGDVNRHSALIRSFSIVHDTPISPLALTMFVDLLRSAHGEKLLRMKGIVHVAGQEKPVVLHGVQSVFHAPETLAAWPDPTDRRTRLVLITHDLPEAFVRDLFAAFTSQPAVDRPDAAALTDNPLSVPGLRF